MSKAMKALAKLARMQADEIQRGITALAEREAGVMARMDERRRLLERESAAAATGDGFAGVTLVQFMALERQRQAADEAECARLRREADILRETLGDAFREAKKLETILDERWAQERRDVARREQAEADDRSVRQG